jgi:predicted ATPase/transcriptional regulator with XRE-family HTH domain/Flp pilus assembly protein TadD
MDALLTFGPWLKLRRKTLDLTQQALADRAHCSIVSIRKIESSALTPSKQLAAELAHALEIASADHKDFIHFARSRFDEKPAAAFSHRSEPSPRSIPIATTARMYHVPASLTSIIGREWEVSAASDLLRKRARLLTLSGPPGAGKTRLSLALAETLQAAFTHGACFVSLASITDPALIGTVLAEALSVTEMAGRSLMVSLHTYLHDKQLLLVLDNFEQVIDGAPQVTQLLQAAPGVKILVSSREPLKVYGEHEFPVPPLTVPNLKEVIAVPDLKMYSAIELFEQRAQAVQPRFAVEAGNAATIVQLCARLDGLPLAIEMAAARIRWSSPEKLLEQLTQHLSTLDSELRDHTPRQRTLRGAIDWSYHLLDEAEQRLFDAGGVFAGGFSAEAISQIASDPQASSRLQLLNVKSLVKYEVTTDGLPRYGLLEMMREYARDQLAARGQLVELRQRHAAFYTALAEQAGREMGGPCERQALDQLDMEHDNLRAALTWVVEQNTPTELLRLCAALGWFWDVRGHWTEGRRWIDRVLEQTQEMALDPDQHSWRATTLYSGGLLNEHGGQPAVTRDRYTESLALRRELNDPIGCAEALNGLGRVASSQGDFVEAQRLLTESIELFRANGERRGQAWALNNLGYVAHAQGNITAAQHLCEASLALRRELGDQLGQALSLNSLGYIALQLRDFARAQALYGESLDIRRRFNDRLGLVSTLNNLGVVASDTGDFETARSYYLDALSVARELGAQHNLAGLLINLGNVVYQQQEWEGARAYYEAGRAEYAALNEQRNVLIAINCLGNVSLREGKLDEAWRCYADALPRRRAIGDKRGVLHTLAGMAGYWHAMGRLERAATLAVAVRSLSTALKLPLDRPELRFVDEAITTARDRLERSIFDAARERGEGMTLETAEAMTMSNDK